MTLAPLELRDFPAGERNVERLVAIVSLIVPPGLVTIANVKHDDGCPSLDGGDFAACSCERVDVVLELIPRIET